MESSYQYGLLAILSETIETEDITDRDEDDADNDSISDAD